jgi:RHS repeat-associated protein
VLGATASWWETPAAWTVACSAPEADPTCGDAAAEPACGSFPKDCTPEPSSGDSSGAGGGQGRNDTESCKDTAGTDPLHLSTKSAFTEPFVDFQYGGLVDIKLERVYSSADQSVPKPGYRAAGTPGAFGRGWHHNWEAYVTCRFIDVASTTATCTLVRGLKSQKIFNWVQGQSATIGTQETWDYYTRQGVEAVIDGDQDLLVRRVVSGATAEFVLYGVDGTEFHFAQYPVTDSENCAYGDATYCPAAWGVGGKDAMAGGKAALTRTVTLTGQAVAVTRSIKNNLLLSLKDEATGSMVELKSDPSNLALATRLLVNSSEYVAYGYTSDSTPGAEGVDLTSVKATPDARLLRSYAYGGSRASSGHLAEIRGEAPLGQVGPTLVGFEYDASYRAVRVVDQYSDVSVSYPAATNIIVNRGASGANIDTSTHRRSGGRSVSISDGLGQNVMLMRWAQRQVSCFSDQDGRTTWVDRDSSRRVVRVRRFEPSVFKCSSAGDPTASMVAVSDVAYAYGLERTLAAGIPTVKLDIPTSVTQASIVTANTNTIRSYDFSSASVSSDPLGYSCAPTGVTLPAGAAPCRVSETGVTRSRTGAVATETRVTYLSYDQYARVTKLIGPISTARPYPDDVVPMETRTYHAANDAQLARRGRLASFARSPNGAVDDPNSFVMRFDYVQTGVSIVSLRRWYASPQAFAEDTFTLVNDSRGRATSVVGPAGATSLEYFDERAPSLIVNSVGGATRITYGSYARANELTALNADPRAPGATPATMWRETRSYDLSGNPALIERFDASGSKRWSQSRTFDADHRPLKEFHPTDATRLASWEYDPAGITKAWVDELGIRTELPLDPIGRPTGADRVVRDAGGALLKSLHLASYTWETPVDLVKTVTDGAGTTTTYEHDDFGRVVTVTSPNALGSTPVRLEWDARSNLKARTLGQATVVLTYDGENRPRTVSASSLAGAAPVYLAFTYDYDGAAGSMVGRLRTAAAGTSGAALTRTTTYSWDSAGRLEKESVAVTGITARLEVAHAYDASGAETKLTYPSGFAAVYSRDRMSQVTGVNAISSGNVMRSLASQVSHEPLGPVRSMQFGNGLTMSRTSNQRYEPNVLASGPVSLAYTMGWSGNVNGVTANAVDVRSFGYDLADRLTSMTPGHGSGTPSSIYGYSGAAVVQANALSGSTSLPGYAFGYDQQRSLTAVGKYNAAGTQISNTICLVHDALGRLTAVGPALAVLGGPGATACQKEADLASVTVRFEYDAMNRRVARQDGTVWTEYVHDPAGNLLAELTRPATAGGTWATNREYAWVDGQPLAQVEYPTGGPVAGYTYYFHLDHLGQPRALTNQNGSTTVWNAVPARPYGDIAESPGVDPLNGRTVVTNLRLPGQYDERLLAGIGIQGPYYNWNRWYLPTMGRYMELDPIAMAGGFNGPWGPNWYGYAEGNPILNSDPEGLDIDVCLYPSSAGGFGHVGYGGGGTGSTDGFYPAPGANPFDGPGMVHHDDQKDTGKECKTIPSPPSKDQCMAECKARRTRDPGRYKLLSRQCTSFVRDCMKQCGLPAGSYDKASPELFFDGLSGR